MGFLVSGQRNAIIQNITADRRGSSLVIAPGHVLYVATQVQSDASGKVTQLLNTNMTINNIIEGPDTYSNIQSGGTLALKGIIGAQISNINSQHPEGLIQSIYEDQNITFSNMTWASNYPLCTYVPANCNTEIIYTVPTPAGETPTKNLTFNNTSITSTVKPISLKLMGDNLVVNGMNIQTPPIFLPGQTNTSAALQISNTAKATVLNYSYTPLITSYTPLGKYNTPLTAWNTSTNVNANLTVYWPQLIALPKSGAYIITPVSQNVKDPSNVLISTVSVK
jgi:hypothetical protein